ncbi:tyrosine-type recombinase/integrase, partial [Acinetobacter baumannii]
GRRSFATRLIRKGGDIYSIQQLMGHSSILTTQKFPLRIGFVAQIDER